MLVPRRFSEHPLDHQRVHLDKARLEQVQAKQPYLLIFPTVRCQLCALTIKNESIRTIPALDNVEAFVYLASQVLRGEVTTKEDGLDSLSELSQGFVSRVLGVVPCESAQKALSLGHAHNRVPPRFVRKYTLRICFRVHPAS